MLYNIGMATAVYLRAAQREGDEEWDGVGGVPFRQTKRKRNTSPDVFGIIFPKLQGFSYYNAMLISVKCKANALKAP